jgi:hypothetical protein
MISLAAHGALLGLGATILFDLWLVALGLKTGSPPDMSPLGRWVWRMKDGVFRHDDIGKAAPYAREKALGWAVHYAVGLAYGVIFALIIGPGWLAAPTLLPAWIFGIVTLGAGWFILQHCLGAGMAASRTPNPGARRIEGLIGHTVFGIGIWLTALLIR